SAELARRCGGLVRDLPPRGAGRAARRAGARPDRRSHEAREPRGGEARGEPLPGALPGRLLRRAGPQPEPAVTPSWSRAVPRLLLLLALPAVLLAGRLGLADRPHVIILGPSSDHLAVVRMRGELAMLGIDVDVVIRAQDAGQVGGHPQTPGQVG